MHTLTFTELMVKNQKKLDLIENSSDGRYKTELLPLIQTMASWFNSLPLNTVFYDEPGGGFRCCIESAYFVMRLAKDAIFTSEKSSNERRTLEPQFRQAAFIAAMVSWADEPFRHFDIVYGARQFIPGQTDLTAYLSGSDSFTLQNKVASQPASRQRTMAMASSIILPLIANMHDQVQDALFSAINPERLPQNSESVLQRVVRKGLGQAEEVERKSKNLLVKPADRTVSSAFMLQQAEAATRESMQAATATDDTVALAAPDDAPGARLPAREQSAGERGASTDSQSALFEAPLGLPEMPRQYHELFAYMAQDIREGKKNLDETRWTEGGLTIPKKFFGGHGKSVSQCIEPLRALKVIVGIDSSNVLLIASVGELLIPRNKAGVDRR